MKFSRLILQSLVLSIVLLGFPALLAFGADPATGPVIVNPAEIKWQDAPPSLPKGAKIAVLHGDPGKSGPYVMRLKMPAGYKIPPHWHTQDENLTVLTGTFNLGYGDQPTAAAAHALKAGGFHYLPGKSHHYAFTKVPAVVQVHGEGPFDINYVKPEDEPGKGAGK
jgi:quercetin dioxygenase-like cupin family protein